LVVTGRAVQNAAGVQLDLAGKGPGQIDATVKGQIAPGFGSADLAIKGTAQAALGNAFVAPRAISGRLGFDLRLNGPLDLASVSGPVALTEGRLADPGQNFAFQGINGKADLARGRMVLSGTAEVTSGGQIAVNGSADLEAPFNGDLAIDVRNVTLRDPDLYEATLNGGLTMQGPLAGGATIAGRIALTETELRVPSTGFGGAGGLPGLQHVNEPSDVRATRDRAGLIADAARAGVTGPAFGLDVTLSAPNRLFLRGRGLDAELGGELRLLGSTAAVQPVGAFNLIRGRLEILGKRLELSEALLQMEGALVPFLRIVASIDNDGITSGVLIEGPATDPKVTFTSSPQLPEEEVLAQLLFGQTLQDLSVLQALQLANAVATLAGKGGEGVVGRLRDVFGLDNLDVKTDAAGGASVTAGKYITESIYTEVTVDQAGQSQINLNLDVTDSLILRGRASSDGTAGLGVVLEKDY
jgi:translocation and assembly module TamB